MKTKEHIVDTTFDLKNIWMQNTDLRLGQLIGNLNEDIYFMEDEVLIKKLREFYGIKSRR
jgi:hypothetical protein